jgi:starch-binding outer membrane protein, SusD/RagB family
VIGWNDGSLPDYHTMSWSSNNEFITAMYNRIFYQVALANEFIRETTDEKLTERGVATALSNDIKAYRAEARFLRALSYWHAIDMFGSVPFVTEADKVGSFLPKQISRAELFTYLESELKAIEGDLKPARQNDYARADQGAAWMLLAKLYLNAEVYIGQAKNTECVTYCNKIIAAGYELNSEYRTLFLADNNTSKEIIFPVAFDGTRTKTWGGMTFLCHAPIGGTMKPADFGVNGGWAGLRTTKGLTNQFPDLTGAMDSRSMFHTDGQNAEIANIFEFKDGYPATKYKNVTSEGKQGSDGKGEFPDTDYPMFRLADVYLMYAEAVVRGGTGGDVATATNYVNKLRQRGYKGNGGDIASSALNLDFILSERARELYWEGHRRTDLIRFGKFTNDTYLWPFKGGKKDGQAVPDFLVLYPIPASDLSANPNLVQNKGY